jgi:hypothetical protein
MSIWGAKSSVPARVNASAFAKLSQPRSANTWAAKSARAAQVNSRSSTVNLTLPQRQVTPGAGIGVGTWGSTPAAANAKLTPGIAATIGKWGSSLGNALMSAVGINPLPTLPSGSGISLNPASPIPAGSSPFNLDAFVAAQNVPTAVKAVSVDTPNFLRRIANAVTGPTSSNPALPVTAASPLYPNDAYQPGGDDSGGGGGSGGAGGSGGSSGSAGDQPAQGDDGGDGGYDDGGDDGGGSPYNYGSDNADTGNSGGYSQQGGGSPADSYASDSSAIEQTEAYNPPDRDTGSADYGGALGPTGFDNDDDEATGGQDYPQVASSAANESDPSAVESWNFADRQAPNIPDHMYTAPRHRPGGEEGDDEMDAGDYVAALNGYQSAGMAGFTDILKSVGKSVGVDALNTTAKALGAAGGSQVKVTKPPMSGAAMIGIAVAVAIPAIYLLKSHKSAPAAPAVATNPRRRRRRRRSY